MNPWNHKDALRQARFKMGLTGAAPVAEGSGSNFVLGHTELGNSFLYHSYRMIAFDEFPNCEATSFKGT